jgi:predicted porin
MKKHLIAAAVAAAVAVPAAAQVTVYGGVGAAMTSTELSGSKGATSMGQSTSQDYLSTTAIGLRGSEDLGGGLKASFTLEGDLAMDGTLGATGNPLFNRFSNVSLSGGFGAFTIGRQNDSLQDVKGLGQFSNLSDNLHFKAASGNRYNNTWKYQTPTIGGISANYAYSNNTGTTTADGTKTLNSFNVRYAAGPLQVAVARSQQTEVSADDETSTYVGARYTMGAIAFGAGMTKSKDGTNELTNTIASVQYTTGPYRIVAHAVRDSVSGNGNPGAVAGRDVDGDGYGLIAAYNLSKRTALFAAYADYDADGTVTNDQKVTSFGVFHKF